ncbi:MAG: DJ-1/PfpI family protein [Asgard group archaeon]|nr:DJ-1/PfpI family protein [Asgard group archaeon]
MKKKNYLLFLMILFLFGIINLNNSSTSINAVNTHDVKVLVLMDDGFGYSYQAIFSEFDKFGWDIDIAGPTSTISGCQYNSVDLDVDLLFSEISDITSYHCVNIMPGSSHVNLMSNLDGILDVIKTASDAGVVISAWCRAVRVLAAADGIDGKNITGNEDYASEYIAAGATFYSNYPPIICDNIVTMTGTQAYMTDMLKAMTQAIGCFEDNPPILGDVSVITLENLSRLLIVQLEDESGISEVKAILSLNSTTYDPSPPPTINIYLIDIEDNNTFSGIIHHENHGFYTAKLEVTDIFWNIFNYYNIATIEVGTSVAASFNFIIAFGSITISSIIFLLARNRKRFIDK